MMLFRLGMKVSASVWDTSSAWAITAWSSVSLIASERLIFSNSAVIVCRSATAWTGSAMNRTRSPGRGIKSDEKSPQRFTQANSRFACLRVRSLRLFFKNSSNSTLLGEDKNSFTVLPGARSGLSWEKEAFHESSFPCESRIATSEVVASRKASTPHFANQPASSSNPSGLAGTAPPKLAFQHVHRKMDHRRPAVRAGARRGTGFQVKEQGSLFIQG